MLPVFHVHFWKRRRPFWLFESLGFLTAFPHDQELPCSSPLPTLLPTLPMEMRNMSAAGPVFDLWVFPNMRTLALAGLFQGNLRGGSLFEKHAPVLQAVPSEVSLWLTFILHKHWVVSKGSQRQPQQSQV